MNTKDTPPLPDPGRPGAHEGLSERELWEHQRLQEFGLDERAGDVLTFCPHCRREMLDRLARAQARGSALFQVVRREGLSPLSPGPMTPEDELLFEYKSWLQARHTRLQSRRTRRLVAAAAFVLLMLWTALDSLPH
ncbi:uncharacterized protein SOCE26_062590 [Sorangium cellulosum]|uniref:Transmembrane protein n=1 Tax=Sorangium cellulosum TaxID=56 RepID=A0A2L0EZR6_SORCE|nr:hypothetical protein [Sorangium cellulosum]AUX44791.1 uncharacterized protein SOCE26_062590 [Sorangium cellulosum]